jgi:hypothetical protein
MMPCFLRAIAVPVVSLLLAVSLGAQVREKATVAASGDTTLSATLNRTVVRLGVSTVTVKRGDSLFPANAVDGTHVYTLIRDLQLKVAGQSVGVPRSAFADLLDPREVSMWFENREFVARISGGDASESYFAVLYFDANRVKRKFVYSSLTPTTAFEETRYKVNVLADR